MNWFRTFMRVLYTELLLRTRLGNYCLPTWRYNFTVPQLIFLCQCLEQTRNVPGGILEVGCSIGSTTIFLNKYMDSENIEKPFFCLDTFSGFLESDIRHEVLNRGKIKNDYSQLGPISMCLLDVDLYIPTRKSLPKIYELLNADGLLIVDDCDPTCAKWDGAWQAYSEFISEIDHPQRIVLNKLGVINKCRK